MENLKKRCELDKKDCWDLTKIIKDEKEFNDLISKVKNCSNKIVDLKGHILENADNLYTFFTLNEEEGRAFGRLMVYSKLLLDEDTSVMKNKEKYLKVEALSDEVNEQEAFVLSEFMEKDEADVIKLIEKKKELEPYKLYVHRMYHLKMRVLSEKEEQVIALARNAFGTPDDAFTSLDVTDASFGKIKVDGKTVGVNHYNFPLLLEHKDQKVRKNAFKTFYKFYEKHKNTYASLLKGNYKELEFERKIRKYNTALDMALDNIYIDAVVYENLIKKVHEYMNLNITYQKLKAKLLGNKSYHLYDTYVPIGTNKEKYTKEEAICLVLKALSPLKEDYLNHFKSILNNQTIDFYSNIGKENGAYQWGCYDSPSYVLLNFNGSFDSVSTLAHEMGHAVHSMYSKENNEYIYYDYEIFVAEIASTVNETLLSFYSMDHAKNKEEKIYYLCEFLDKVKATIYRQTMFAEFEQIMSEKTRNNVSLTEKEFSDTYYDLNKTYFLDSVIIDDEIRYEWMRISHFYRPFYVYQYATGLICALCIVSDILKDDKEEKYIRFLKGGCSKNVLDLLKDVDIDLTSNVPFDKAFNLIKEKLEELQELVKEDVK